jgi:hypothetical protein|tara:strand:+ start:145 stop:315 length:171 start_codon:yes stop_codon:yes gene_type:complete
MPIGLRNVMFETIGERSKVFNHPEKGFEDAWVMYKVTKKIIRYQNMIKYSVLFVLH